MNGGKVCARRGILDISVIVSMNWTLFILGMLLQAAIGLLGVYVTFRPPKKVRHFAYLGIFSALTIGVLVIAMIQKYRADVEQAGLQGRLDERLKTIQKSSDTLLAGMAEIRKFTTSDATKMSRVEKPWGLSVDQLARLAQRLSPYATKEKRGDLITCVLGNVQSTRFAENLVAAYRSAGWVIDGTNQAVFSGLPEGILIKLHSKASSPASLAQFVSTIREAGIEPTGIIDENIPEGKYQIIVGAEPTPQSPR